MTDVERCEWERCPGFTEDDEPLQHGAEDGPWHEPCHLVFVNEEAAYYSRFYRRRDFEPTDDGLGYDRGDPKAPGFIDDLLERADGLRKEARCG